jgi:hypothetical protein
MKEESINPSERNLSKKKVSVSGSVSSAKGSVSNVNPLIVIFLLIILDTDYTFIRQRSTIVLNYFN